MGNSSSQLSQDEAFRSEDSYSGEFNELGQYNGNGTLFYASDDDRQRDRYVGEWTDGRRHGKGTLSWSNGAVYQGTWKNDMLHGMGMFMLPSGLCYEGEFCRNQFEGLGVLIWKSGKRYEGSWKANRHHGFGCLTYPANDQRKRKYYKGEWSNGKRHGYGVMVWSNGAKYEGNWNKGKREGQGKHTFPSNQVYIGSWQNGRREGTGCRYFCNGDRFIGTWKRDKKDGIGYYIFAHGRKVPRLHHNGKLVEDLKIPQEVQSLQVLCIEKVAEQENFLPDLDKNLTTDLAERVRKYRQNELMSNPEHSLIQKVQNVLFRFSPTSKDS